jgi:acyl-CoA dehydrogenase
MSVPYLMKDAKGSLPASERIPVIAKPFVSERAKKTLDLVEKFVEEECIPADAVYQQQIGVGASIKDRFDAHPPVIEDLKKKAKQLGLWNMFLPKNHFKEGAGFSNLEYGLMAEYLGRSGVASEASRHPSAPDLTLIIAIRQ